MFSLELNWPQRRQVVDFGFAVRANLFTAMTSTTDKPKLNIWVYMNIFPIAAWAAILGAVVFAAVWGAIQYTSKRYEKQPENHQELCFKT